MLNYAEIVHALRSGSLATRAKLLADLKEKNEIYHGGEYVVYLKELFPVYVELLHAIPPQVINHFTRRCVLFGGRLLLVQSVASYTFTVISCK